MTPQAPKIYVAGHRGMVGSAIVRHLQSLPCGSGAPAANVITRTHAELDLTNQAAVQAFFAQEKPDQVYLAAAKVGGIHANNTYPAEFIYDNPQIEIKHRGKDKRLTDEERRLLKRRQAIEPIIGHIKADHRMDRCHLKGSEGDAMH